MATFTDPRAFAQHVSKYGDQISDASSVAVKEAGIAAVQAIRSEGKRHRIKGRSGKRVTLGAKLSPVQMIGGNASVLIEATPPGFWKLIQEGAGPHIIRPRRRSRAKTRAALATPYGFFAVVHHPGTGGQIADPWGAGVRDASREAPKAFERSLIKTVFG
jgi:hypothetical protein